MTMPVNSKTWVIPEGTGLSVNTGSALTDSQTMILEIYNQMVASGSWVVERTCNSVAVADSAPFNWNTTADIVWPTGGGDPRSWAVLYNATMGIRFLIAATGASGVRWNMTLQYSEGAFSTGGTTTAIPTSASTTVTICTTNAFIATTGQKYLHLWFSNDDTCFRMVVCQGGKAVCLWILDTIANPVSGITQPLDLVYGYAIGDNTSAADRPTVAVLSTGTPLIAYATGGGAITYRMVAEGYSATVASILTAANPRNSSAWLIQTLGLLTLTNVTYAYGRDGDVPDLWFVPPTCITGDTMPGDGSKTHVVLGNVLFPWNGGAISIS